MPSALRRSLRPDSKTTDRAKSLIDVARLIAPRPSGQTERA